MSRLARADLIIENAAELLTCRAGAADLIGVVRGGSLAVAGERIVEVGPAHVVSQRIDRSGARVLDASGQVLMPGFVDCHTHVVFAGSRVDEFAARLRGVDAATLAAQGLPVGIAGTAAQTRAAGLDQLVEETSARLREMLDWGTTTVESKSGYGLETDAELRILEAGMRLDELQPIDIVNTFLGAHAVPAGVSRDGYVDRVVQEMIPRVAAEGLAAFCDVYCEEGFFTVDETARILGAGVLHGLRPKLHMDAYTRTGAAMVAVNVGCISVDHLNFTQHDELRAMGDAGITAVVMPGLDLSVGHPKPASARTMLDNGIPVALATDMCPSCWLPSMQFVIGLACRSSGMTVPEAIRAATLDAARAIGREDEIGSLETGKLADIIILDVARHEDLAYRIGRNAVATVVKRGTVVREQA